jgi:hypothetical protein
MRRIATNPRSNPGDRRLFIFVANINDVVTGMGGIVFIFLGAGVE